MFNRSDVLELESKQVGRQEILHITIQSALHIVLYFSFNDAL